MAKTSRLNPRASIAWLIPILCILISLSTSSNVNAGVNNEVGASPVILFVSPAQGVNNAQTQISITGNNFVAPPTISLDNIPIESTFINSQSISAKVPEDLPGGVYTLTVTNPDEQFAQLVNAFSVQWSGDGSLSSWKPTTPMTVERWWPGAVVVGHYLYVLGGSDRTFEPINSVERATIYEDGSLSSWTPMSPMTSGKNLLSALKIGRYLYALGSSWYNSNSIERALINADGTLGQWEIVNPSGPSTQAAVKVGNYIYSFGDQIVQWAPIISGDEIGVWQTAPAMNLPRGYMGATAVGNYLYAIGGQNMLLSYPSMRDVERAPINPDGSPGPWQKMPSLNVSRCDLGAVSAYGYIYAIGGGNCSSNQYSSVEKATIGVDGITKPWEFVSSMSSKRLYPAVARYKSFIYAIGGEETTGTLLNTVDVAEVNPATRPVIDPYEYGITINDGALFTNRTAVTLTIGARPGTAMMMVSNDGGFAWATWETYTLHKAWTITQYGVYTMPRVVYVRYKDNLGNTTPTYQDDIILDVTPPTGSVKITPSNSQGLAGQKNQGGSSREQFQLHSSVTYTNTIYLAIIYGPPPIVTLHLVAQDDVSGVEGMIISNSPDFSGAHWEAYGSTKQWQVPSLTGTITVYVKFRDYANNISQVIEGTYTP